MSEENLGRVQGAGFFFSTAVSSTSVDMATLSPSTIKPVYGDNIIFANGDIRNVTAVSDTAVTCGGVVANLQGADGVHIISSVLQGQDEDGGNIYLQTFSDNTTATFTAPRGLEGLGILYSSADADAQTTLFTKDSVTIPAGREIKVGDIIFCNAHLFSVNAVSETSFSVIHLAYFSTDSAQKDGNGNVIADTYATKSDLTDGTITVKNAINAESSAHADFASGANNADFATAATKAYNDGDGNVIVDTYATKAQLSDGSVTKVGTATKGSSTQPIYLNAGTPTACSRTIPSITLNGSLNSTPSFYAPESDGSQPEGGQVLVSSGDGTAPVWATGTIGSLTKPIYLKGGVPTPGTYTLAAACAKSVSDSSSASALSSTDTNVPTVRDIYYGLPFINGSHSYTSSKTIYAPTVDTGGRWLRGTGLGEPEWALPINIQDSYTEISSNKTLPDLGVGHTGVICYFTSSSSTYTIYLPSSGEWAFAYQISNSYYNGAVEQFSSAKSVAWRNSAVSGGNAMCSIKGNGKYTSIMIIYTRTK